MIQAISSEQSFVTSLEKFVGKADKFIRLYYSGNSEGEDLKEILALVAKLNSDATVEQLEVDYLLHCDRQDLEADYYDSAWF